MAKHGVLTITKEQKKCLIKNAKKAMQFSYSSYSGNKVGVALLSQSGAIYTGANMGNSCSSLNVCAEQIAIGVAMMHSDLKLSALALVSSSGEHCVPCGRCLQLLSEFADDMIILSSIGSDLIEYKLKYLLPKPYRRPMEGIFCDQKNKENTLEY
jgi:homotetrameric cytidine deaminase